jgi:hypothetical protein
MPPVAKADEPLSLDQWPSEGRTLGAILKQLISPALWLVLTDRTGECLPHYLKAYAKMGLVSLVELDPLADADKPTDVVEAIRKCQPLLEHWKSGALIAKGRRGDPLSPAVDIRPPTNWELWVADFSRSTIEDPVGQEKRIYDLRFFRPESQRDVASAVDTVSWVTAEAKRMKAAGEVNEGISITNFAQRLEKQMRKAAKTDNSIRPVGWQHIRNKLSTWGLWPIESIKIS